MARRTDRVVLLGRDAPLWLAASSLRAALGASGVSVTAVELPSRLGPADVYAAQPALEALHNRLGLSEAAMLRTTGGAFTLGGNFVDLEEAAATFFHAFGSYGAPIDRAEFFPYWLKARGLGLTVPLEDFSLTAAAARHGRMMIPDDETAPFGRTDYGYHLPALAYAARLKALGRRLGVAVLETTDAHAVLSETGDIAAVELADGQRLEGDLYVDVSGAEARLIGALDKGFESWRALFPADRVLSARAPAFGSIPVYSEVRASSGGWTALYPTRAATFVVHAFASAHDDEASAWVQAQNASGLALSDGVVRATEPGRREGWRGNCLALGEAACALDPLHGLDLQALQLGLVRLLALFPTDADFGPLRVEYNQRTAQAFERLRDFQVAHYRLARYGGAFWSAARSVPAPTTLGHKIETFLARGEVPVLEDESFGPESWRVLFIGHGLEAETYDPTIDRTPPELIRQELRRILGFVRDQVLSRPTHDEHLASLVGGGASAGAGV